MAELVELNSSTHKTLKVVDSAELDYAASQHILNVRVAEVGQAVTSFPVFLMKDVNSGYWKLSAITSFEAGSNLFVQDNQWQAVFKPSQLQTYPFFLMNSPQGDNQYTIGIVEQSDAFSTENGQTVFDDNGKASIMLSQVKTKLETDIQRDIQTFQFGKALDELGLCKSINLVLTYQDGTVQKLQGLCTIDEDKLNSLSTEQIAGLQKQGYLMPIHAMLISINQLNGLIQRNNRHSQFKVIQQIKLEVNKPNVGL